MAETAETGTAEPAESSEMTGSHKRACDQCRARKIRCDKGPGDEPCSGCRAAQRHCKSTYFSQKTKDVKHRVLISHQYEQKIDGLDSRLGRIERLLQGLTATWRSQNAAADDSLAMRTYTSPSSLSESNTVYGEQHPSTARNEGGDDAVPLETAFEGTSSMTAQTALAGAFLEQVVTDTPPAHGAAALQPDMRRALSALREIAHQRHCRTEGKKPRPPSALSSRHFPRQKPVPRGGVCQLPLPPTDAVLKLLREIRATPPMAFMMSCAFLDLDDFISSCRDVYFATEDFSLAQFVVVNAGLYYLFEEKVATHKKTNDDSSRYGSESGNTTERAMFAQYQRLCGDNLETALANLPLFLPPSGDMVDALLLGVTYAIENSRFTLAWQLNSAAASMCQTLGWHHHAKDQSTANASGPAPKLGAFWFCYMFDKGLALRFGRTCMLPDWDISTPRDLSFATADGSGKSAALGRVFNVWIRTGSILGQTYEHLYSPAALARSPDQRAATAQQLVASAKQIWAEFQVLAAATTDAAATVPCRAATDTATATTSDEDGWRRATLERVMRSGEVGHLAMLTLIYRAIPQQAYPSPYHSSSMHAECVAAARAAFRAHQACMALADGDPLAQAGYLHWTVLYAPFTPLIVVFCHIIEEASRKRHGEPAATPGAAVDLALLEAFAASLEPLHAVSPAIARMHSLSRLLHQMAVLYVQADDAGNSEQPERQRAGSDVNMEASLQIDPFEMPQGVGIDMDLYLSQLGFLPNAHTSTETTTLVGSTPDDQTFPNSDAGNMMIAAGNPDGSNSRGPFDAPLSPRLEEWFSGSTYVMGLVEDDLRDFGWDPVTGSSF